MTLFKGSHLKCILEPLGPTLRFSSSLSCWRPLGGSDLIASVEGSHRVSIPDTLHPLSGLPFLVFFVQLSHALLTSHLFSLVLL